MSLGRVAPALCILLLACSEDALVERPTLTREELMKPSTCLSCHPSHYREWQASMHAYASSDPVFIAMNELGQQETDGGLGDFCVQCHAPMAVREGATEDGRNLAELPEELQGVTCYFCHNIESVEGDHNAQLTLANDTTMRGAMIDPVRPSAHRVKRSSYMYKGSPDSAQMCGACHDIVNDHGVHLERTFAEYKASIFSDESHEKFATCVGCHMRERTDFAADKNISGVKVRTDISSHLFAGVDVALTENWPDREAYKRVVECELADSAIFNTGFIEFDGMNVTVQVDTNAGHNMPSGSAQDRRLWVELTAFDENGEVQCTTGEVPDDEVVATFIDPRPCPTLDTRPFRDVTFDADGGVTHMFWRVAPSDDHLEGFRADTLLPPLQDNPDHTTFRTFELPLDETNLPPPRLRLRLRIRPMDHDVLEELVEHGLLDSSIPGEIPTFTIPRSERELVFNGATYEWGEHPDYPVDCDAVRCEFTSSAPGCNQRK